MTALEWSALAERVSLLWPPAMSAQQLDAYWQILEPLPALAVDRALTLIARMPRSHRPDVGLIRETAMNFPQPALPPADVDVLLPEEHRYVMAQLSRSMSDEHKRRMAAVRALRGRLSLNELQVLMAKRGCSAEEFDRSIALKRAEGGTS